MLHAFDIKELDPSDNHGFATSLAELSAFSFIPQHSSPYNHPIDVSCRPPWGGPTDACGQMWAERDRKVKREMRNAGTL